MTFGLEPWWSMSTLFFLKHWWNNLDVSVTIMLSWTLEVIHAKRHFCIQEKLDTIGVFMVSSSGNFRGKKPAKYVFNEDMYAPHRELMFLNNTIGCTPSRQLAVQTKNITKHMWNDNYATVISQISRWWKKTRWQLETFFSFLHFHFLPSLCLDETFCTMEFPGKVGH